MAATSLAYIDKTVDNLLQKERKNPTPHQTAVVAATTPRKIGGFHITDNAYAGARLQEAKDKRREIVNKYFELRRELADEFDAIGVKPLAILPTGMFKKLCEETGMYFVPKSGKTQINPTHFLTWAQNKFPAQVDIDRDAEILFQALESAGIGQRQRVRIKKRDIDDTVQTYIKEFSHNIIVRRLLNAPMAGDDVKLGEMRGATGRASIRQYHSPTDTENYELLLPEPPKEVIERLIKCANAGINPNTVAVYEAMDFVGGVDPILYKAANDLAQHEERERDRIEWMLNDPIVYLSRGPVTAVIDQFGPFPIEKELVDRVQAAEFLPVNL
jgi:hypothetical protein